MFVSFGSGSGFGQNLKSFVDLTYSIYGKCPPCNLIGPASLHFQIKSVWLSVNIWLHFSIKKVSVDSHLSDTMSSEC